MSLLFNRHEVKRPITRRISHHDLLKSPKTSLEGSERGTSKGPLPYYVTDWCSEKHQVCRSKNSASSDMSSILEQRVRAYLNPQDFQDHAATNPADPQIEENDLPGAKSSRRESVAPTFRVNLTPANEYYDPINGMKWDDRDFAWQWNREPEKSRPAARLNSIDRVGFDDASTTIGSRSGTEPKPPEENPRPAGFAEISCSGSIRIPEKDHNAQSVGPSDVQMGNCGDLAGASEFIKGSGNATKLPTEVAADHLNGDNLPNFGCDEDNQAKESRFLPNEGSANVIRERSSSPIVAPSDKESQLLTTSQSDQPHPENLDAEAPAIEDIQVTDSSDSRESPANAIRDTLSSPIIAPSDKESQPPTASQSDQAQTENLDVEAPIVKVVQMTEPSCSDGSSSMAMSDDLNHSTIVLKPDLVSHESTIEQHEDPPAPLSPHHSNGDSKSKNVDDSEATVNDSDDAVSLVDSIPAAAVATPSCQVQPQEPPAPETPFIPWLSRLPRRPSAGMTPTSKSPKGKKAQRMPPTSKKASNRSYQFLKKKGVRGIFSSPTLMPPDSAGLEEADIASSENSFIKSSEEAQTRDITTAKEGSDRDNNGANFLHPHDIVESDELATEAVVTSFEREHESTVSVANMLGETNAAVEHHPRDFGLLNIVVDHMDSLQIKTRDEEEAGGGSVEASNEHHAGEESSTPQLQLSQIEASVTINEDASHQPQHHSPPTTPPISHSIPADSTTSPSHHYLQAQLLPLQETTTTIEATSPSSPSPSSPANPALTSTPAALNPSTPPPALSSSSPFSTTPSTRRSTRSNPRPSPSPSPTPDPITQSEPRPKRKYKPRIKDNPRLRASTSPARTRRASVGSQGEKKRGGGKWGWWSVKGDEKGKGSEKGRKRKVGEREGGEEGEEGEEAPEKKKVKRRSGRLRELEEKEGKGV